MVSVGEQLKKERESKKISLEEVAGTLRINKKILEALENDQYESPFPSVYLKGFLRSYCRYLGLDEKEILPLYDEVCGYKKAESSHQKENKTEKTVFRGTLLVLLIILTVLLVILGRDILIKSPPGTESDTRPQRGPQSGSPAVPPVSSSPPEVAIPVAALPPDETMPPLNGDDVSQSSVAIMVNCQQSSWMEVGIDGERPFEVMGFKGDTVSWEAKEKIELKVGNAGGVVISVNGIPLKPLGNLNEVVRVTFRGETVSINGGKCEDLKAWQHAETEEPAHN
ncbi:MAG: DUF4115 domain-containing protein [Deltaproteobacteria bacterium]|nr:DUF4115 domain-containing protein [Deltaproteobacteria bacterium]